MRLSFVIQPWHVILPLGLILLLLFGFGVHHFYEMDKQKVEHEKQIAMHVQERIGHYG